MKIDERKIGQITEAVKIAVETVEKKNRPEGNTQRLNLDFLPCSLYKNLIDGR